MNANFNKWSARKVDRDLLEALGTPLPDGRDEEIARLAAEVARLRAKLEEAGEIIEAARALAERVTAETAPNSPDLVAGVADAFSDLSV